MTATVFTSQARQGIFRFFPGARNSNADAPNPTVDLAGNPVRPAGATGEHPVYRTLAYGKSWQRGPFTCTSRVTGVTCRNRTGHGLFISRQAYRTW